MKKKYSQEEKGINVSTVLSNLGIENKASWIYRRFYWRGNREES